MTFVSRSMPPRLILASIVLLLSACVGPLDQGPGLERASRGFSEAMRWQDFHGAARFLESAQQEAFFEQFAENSDLHVVDSWFRTIEVDQAAGTAEAEYLLKYYLLPSNRVRTWSWSQEWRLIRGKMTKPGIWMITAAPPPFPGDS